MASPWSSMSSPVFSTAVTPAGGTVRTSPASRRAAPTPPHRTATLVTAATRARDALELPLEQRQVGVDHEVDQLLEAGLRLPAEHPARLRGVADEHVDLGGPEEPLVHHDVLLPVEADPVEGELAELPHRVGLPG